ncbi:gamma-glutamylcyclotransferase family protein [Thermocrinis sp.]
MAVYYFAYGSNMNLSQMRERCKNTWERIEVGYVEGYRLVFNGWSGKWNGGVADLVEDPSGKVWGVLFKLESFDCLDKHEGYPSVYNRKKLIVIVPKLRRKFEAEAYIKTSKEDESKPSESYINTIIEGAKENGLPEDWIAFLESHRNVSDFQKDGSL